MLPFCFKNESGTRTKHHLIFVTKAFKGYEVMKDIMAKASSSREQGVPIVPHARRGVGAVNGLCELSLRGRHDGEKRRGDRDLVDLYDVAPLFFSDFANTSANSTP